MVQPKNIAALATSLVVGASFFAMISTFVGPTTKEIYDRVKQEVPGFRDKIVLIYGDLSIEGLGLSENDRKLLIHEVSIIFHVAAYLNMNAKIKDSTTINVCATASILNIAKHMPNLKSFVYVSTMYANCHADNIEENFYNTYPINHKSLITLTRTLPENELDEIQARITLRWPNMYTYTKSVAETLLRDEGGDLPIGIFRPAMVLSTAREPIVGWVNNFYGPISLTVSMWLGFLKVMTCDLNTCTQLIPVDFAINALIASAWDVYNNRHRRGKDMLIYNYTSSDDAPNWRKYFNKMVSLTEIYPSSNCVWLPMVYASRHKLLFRIAMWPMHFLPALLMDAASICRGLEPRAWKMFKKLHIVIEMLHPFCTKKWNIAVDNVYDMWERLSERDQRLFEFSMRKFDWESYFDDYFKGLRHHLVKEDDRTLAMSRVKYQRLYWIHQIFVTLLILLTLWIVWSILARIMI